MDISQIVSGLQHIKHAVSGSAAAKGTTASSPGTVAAKPSATVVAKTASTSTKNADITSNDFLTLLVTEMKNQDPTANTDPNAYINQLVQVNSLQQLIQINTDLGGNGTTSTTTGHASSGVANALSKGSAASLPDVSSGNSWAPKSVNPSDWEAAAAKQAVLVSPLNP
jgi:flagellar basal-body rod modification protein FlgD